MSNKEKASYVLAEIKRKNPKLFYRYAYEHETGLRYVFRDKHYADYEFNMFGDLIRYEFEDVD